MGDEVLFRQDPSSGTFIVDAVTATGEAVIYEREDAPGQENRTTKVVSGFKLQLVPPLETRQGRLAVQGDRALYGHEEEQFQAQLTGLTQSSWFDEHAGHEVRLTGYKQDTNMHGFGSGDGGGGFLGAASGRLQQLDRQYHRAEGGWVEWMGGRSDRQQDS